MNVTAAATAAAAVTTDASRTAATVSQHATHANANADQTAAAEMTAVSLRAVIVPAAQAVQTAAREIPLQQE